MRREPRIVGPRRSMAHRLTHEPPDNPWTDVAAIAVSMVMLGVICILASILPVAP